ASGGRWTPHSRSPPTGAGDPMAGDRPRAPHPRDGILADGCHAPAPHAPTERNRSMHSVLDELAWRGLVVQTTGRDALGSALADGPVSLYCGFDPTAASLHVGHLTQVLTMRRLQLAGHHPYALVGGATGLIGDPRLSGARVLNDSEIVATRVETLRDQISRVRDPAGEYGVTMVNNLDWIGQMSALDFLRDMGKHFRMGTMLAKDTVARRLQSDEGISYTEFSYQVLQGIDYLELHRRH